MTVDARNVAHRILGVVCSGIGHNATCDRVTGEIVADRAASSATRPPVADPQRRKRLVYVAGKFRGPNAWAVAENVRAAERVGFEVAQAGAMPLIPHANTAHFDGTMTAEFWVDGTLEMMRRCDALVLVPGWEPSAGTQGEVTEAFRIGIPVFLDITSLRVWLEMVP